MEQQKQRIAPALKEMRVGQMVSYPIQRLDVVRVTVDRLNAMHRGQMKWTTSRQKDTYNVTRIQ